MSTHIMKKSEIKRDWHLIDAKGKILGRLATEVATILMGKNKPNHVDYLDNGDNVVIVNASQVKVTGKKEAQKVYFRHSGYPGGDRRETLSKVRETKPERIIEHAVWGMVPKTKLGKSMIKKLHVYAGSQHDFADKFRSKTDQPRADKKEGETV